MFAALALGHRHSSALSTALFQRFEHCQPGYLPEEWMQFTTRSRGWVW